MVEFSAEVDIGVGEKLDDIKHAVRRYSTPVEQSVPMQGSLVGTSTTTAICQIGGPEGGVEWHIRRISLGQQLGASSVTAGTIIVGKGAAQSGVFTTSGATYVGIQFVEVTRTTTVPNAILFSKNQFVVKYPSNILVVWVDGTGTLIIDGDASEIPLGDQHGL
jgi:hypothetical protein